MRYAWGSNPPWKFQDRLLQERQVEDPHGVRKPDGWMGTRQTVFDKKYSLGLHFHQTGVVRSISYFNTRLYITKIKNLEFNLPCICILGTH